jgi:hypothetical protein
MSNSCSILKGASQDFVPAALRGRVYTRKTSRSRIFAIGRVFDVYISGFEAVEPEPDYDE